MKNAFMKNPLRFGLLLLKNCLLLLIMYFVFGYFKTCIKVDLIRSNQNLIKKGMNKAEVINVLGEPDIEKFDRFKYQVDNTPIVPGYFNIKFDSVGKVDTSFITD